MSSELKIPIDKNGMFYMSLGVRRYGKRPQNRKNVCTVVEFNDWSKGKYIFTDEEMELILTKVSEAINSVVELKEDII